MLTNHICPLHLATVITYSYITLGLRIFWTQPIHFMNIVLKLVCFLKWDEKLSRLAGVTIQNKFDLIEILIPLSKSMITNAHRCWYFSLGYALDTTHKNIGVNKTCILIVSKKHKIIIIMLENVISRKQTLIPYHRSS